MNPEDEFFIKEIIPTKRAIEAGEIFAAEKLKDLAKRVAILFRDQEMCPKGSFIIRGGEDSRGFHFAATSEGDMSQIVRSWPYGNQTEFEDPTEFFPLQKLVIRWHPSRQTDPMIEIFDIHVSGVNTLLNLSDHDSQKHFISLLEVLHMLS